MHRAIMSIVMDSWHLESRIPWQIDGKTEALHLGDYKSETVESERVIRRPAVADRPESRHRGTCVHEAKCDALRRKHVLGKGISHKDTIQWQKRSLPHVHILLILNHEDVSNIRQKSTASYTSRSEASASTCRKRLSPINHNDSTYFFQRLWRSYNEIETALVLAIHWATSTFNGLPTSI